MEEKYSEKKNKIIIGMIVLYVAAIVGINIYYYKSMTGNYNYDISAVDGIVSFLIDNRNIIGTETMILSFLLFYSINPNLNNEYLCMYKNRRTIYMLQIKQALCLNCAFTIANALISFVTTWIMSGKLLDWENLNSIYYIINKRPFQSNFFVFEIYMLLSIIASIIIVQVYLMFYLLIYWLIRSRNATFFIGIVLSWTLGRPIIPKQWMLTSNRYDAVHLLVNNPEKILYGLLKYGVVVLVMVVLTNVVLRRRDII